MGDLDVVVDLVIHDTIGAHGLLDDVGRDPTQIGCNLDKDGHTSCFFLSFSSCAEGCLLRDSPSSLYFGAPVF